MKTFDQLTKEQKQDAIDMATYELMNHIANGSVEITLVNPASQTRLEKILANARKKESTRLVTLHLVHDKQIKEEIYKLGVVAAHGSSYDENGDAIMEGKENVDSILN